MDFTTERVDAAIKLKKLEDRLGVIKSLLHENEMCDSPSYYRVKLKALNAEFKDVTRKINDLSFKQECE
jgi:hypothetical protein